MSIALSVIESEVSGYLQIDSTVDTDKFQIENAANRAQDYLLNKLEPRHLINVIDTDQGNLVSGTGAYSFEADYHKILTIHVDFDNPITTTNRGVQCTVLNGPEDISELIDLQPSQEHPIVITGDDGKFEIYPIPDAAVTDGYLMRYVKRLPTIGSAQACMLMDHLRNLLIFRTCYYCAGVENYDPGKQQFFKQAFDEEMMLIRPSTPGEL